MRSWRTRSYYCASGYLPSATFSVTNVSPIFQDLFNLKQERNAQAKASKKGASQIHVKQREVSCSWDSGEEKREESEGECRKGGKRGAWWDVTFPWPSTFLLYKSVTLNAQWDKQTSYGSQWWSHFYMQKPKKKGSQKISHSS